MIRVIQWGAGTNGSALIRAIQRHPDLQLVGCRVYSDSKNGVDAGLLAGIGPIGVTATNDRQSIIDTPADVAIHCPQLRPDFSQNDQDIFDLLASGTNVISVSGAHSYPAAIPGYAEQFERACAQGGTTFAHTGVNPGFISERLATTLTGLCVDVDAVTINETYNCENGTEDLLFNTMRFGVSLDEWTAESPVGDMFNHLFIQLIHNMAHTLGVDLDRVQHRASVVPAHRDITAGGRVVKTGQVGAIVQSWEGVPKDPDQIRLRKETCWVISDDIPGWPAKRGWQIHLTGQPSLDLHVMLAAVEGDEAAHEPDCMVGAAIPMISEVMAAAPGILLPQVFAPFRKRITSAPSSVAD